MKFERKKKELKRYKRTLTAYLQQNWERGHIPSLRQVITSLDLLNKPLLIAVLRQLRCARILDGSYDSQGVYWLYPFKKYPHIMTDVVLSMH